MRKVTHNPQFWYNPNAKDAFWYAIKVITGRFYEAESIILKEPIYIRNYTKWVIKERWPEAEPILKQSYLWGKYCKDFNIKE